MPCDLRVDKKPIIRLIFALSAKVDGIFTYFSCVGTSSALHLLSFSSTSSAYPTRLRRMTICDFLGFVLRDPCADSSSRS